MGSLQHVNSDLYHISDIAFCACASFSAPGFHPEVEGDDGSRDGGVFLPRQRKEIAYNTLVYTLHISIMQIMHIMYAATASSI